MGGSAGGYHTEQTASGEWWTWTDNSFSKYEYRSDKYNQHKQYCFCPPAQDRPYTQSEYIHECIFFSIHCYPYGLLPKFSSSLGILEEGGGSWKADYAGSLLALVCGMCMIILFRLPICKSDFQFCLLLQPFLSAAFLFRTKISPLSCNFPAHRKKL